MALIFPEDLLATTIPTVETTIVIITERMTILIMIPLTFEVTESLSRPENTIPTTVPSSFFSGI